MKYVHTHQGLGDQFTNNAIVRYYYNLYNEITIFSSHRDFEQIKFMYRDLPNLYIIPVKDDTEAGEIVQTKGAYPNDYIRVGFEKITTKHGTFDESMYLGENLPYDYKWKNFYIERDLEKEKLVFKELNPNNEKYIFCHSVDLNKVRSDLKIINNDMNFMVTDHMLLLENAEEIHLMQSSIKDLVCCMKLDKPKCYLHNYVRGYDSFSNTKGWNYFEVIY
jgi:hypothetical protein